MSSAARAARTAEERTLRYNVMVNALESTKVACAKVLRDLFPWFGLKESLEFVQAPLPVAVVRGVERREARRVRDKLLTGWPYVSLRSTTSTRPELKPVPVPEFKASNVTIVDLSRHTIACEVLTRTHRSHVGCICDCHSSGDDQ